VLGSYILPLILFYFFYMMRSKIALIGCGNIARIIAERTREFANIVCVFDVDKEAASSFCERFGCEFKEVEDFPKVDIVVEAASQKAVASYAEAVLKKNNLLVMSVGSFSDDALLASVKAVAEDTGTQVLLPSGAIAGLDSIKAAKLAGLRKVVITSTKNPRSLEQTEYITNKGIDLSSIESSTEIFSGSAREGVKLFPKNVNVAAALSLAGIGLDKTEMRLVADPSVDKNIHSIHAEGEFGEMDVEVRNVPSPDNPKTSYLAALSAVSIIKSLVESLRVGN
jgi:aspartate dehydrogenase